MKLGKKQQQEPAIQQQPIQQPSGEQAGTLPSSPLAPFTPSILAHLPEPEPEPRSDEPVEPDPNPMAPMAPVAVGTQGKCCGDTDSGGGGGFTGSFVTEDGGVATVVNGKIMSVGQL